MTSDHPAWPEAAPLATAPRIHWQPWTAASFTRAAAEHKPVLLSIGASWCGGCDVMDHTTFSDAAIVEAIAAGFVPIRVDADRRPDINERYNLDGWPTTAVLTPSGEILAGGTYFAPAEMMSMLQAAGTAMRNRYEDLMSRAEQVARTRRLVSPTRYEPDGEAPRWLLARMLDDHDREYGGFGTGGKFLNATLLAFGIAMYRRTGQEEIERTVTRTLDAIAWGGTFDEVDGGFFRYAASRDFTRPHTEKLLEDQAALIPVLLDAAATFRRDAYRERALDVLRYVQRTLSEPLGGFFASQRPDGEFYALSGSIRASMAVPDVDRTVFADLNAQAIVAWVRAAEVFGDPGLVRFALASMERIVTNEHALTGVPHWPAPEAPRNLLTDQIHGAWALMHMAALLDDRSWLTRAEQLMRTVLLRFWDEPSGGFLDRVPGTGDEIGMLQDPVRPLWLNSLAARAMWRLAEQTGEDAWRVRARETLGAVTGSYRSQGLNAAPYAMAVCEILS